MSGSQIPGSLGVGAGSMSMLDFPGDPGDCFFADQAEAYLRAAETAKQRLESDGPYRHRVIARFFMRSMAEQAKEFVDWIESPALRVSLLNRLVALA